jgi:Fur family zinc uptake transcriptional regulator
VSRAASDTGAAVGDIALVTLFQAADIVVMSHSHLACAPDNLADSLREAEALCEQRGGKLTPLRKRVLTLLLESEGPAKA